MRIDLISAPQYSHTPVRMQFAFLLFEQFYTNFLLICLFLRIYVFRLLSQSSVQRHEKCAVEKWRKNCEKMLCIWWRWCSNNSCQFVHLQLSQMSQLNFVTVFAHICPCMCVCKCFLCACACIHVGQANLLPLGCSCTRILFLSILCCKHS